MPFKISENISKASISPGFQGQQSGDQLSPREFRVSRGGGLKKLAMENICNSRFSACLKADKATRVEGVI